MPETITSFRLKPTNQTIEASILIQAKLKASLARKSFKSHNFLFLSVIYYFSLQFVKRLEVLFFCLRHCQTGYRYTALGLGLHDLALEQHQTCTGRSHQRKKSARPTRFKIYSSCLWSRVRELCDRILTSEEEEEVRRRSNLHLLQPRQAD